MEPRQRSIDLEAAETLEKQTPIRLGWIGVISFVLIALAAVAGMLPRWRQREALRSETKELAIQTVSITVPIPGKSMAGLPLPAEVKPFQEAPIYSRANGYLKRWLVDLGSRVEAGDLLAEIDTPEIAQELARARADLVHAQAALELAKVTSARWTQLLKSATVSAQETAEKVADAALKAAAVDGAQASVYRLEELQSFAKVTAPFRGVITARNVEVGDLISTTGKQELFRLAQTRTLRVFVHVPQTFARSIAVGQTAELTIPEIAGRVFTAKVARASGTMNADSRTRLTELELENSQGDILAGSYAEVRFSDIKVDAVLTLPSNTLLFRPDGLQVAVVTPESKIELHPITLGRDFGQTVEVLAGLSATDRVVINPMDSLVTGASIRLAPDSPQSGAK